MNKRIIIIGAILIIIAIGAAAQNFLKNGGGSGTSSSVSITGTPKITLSASTDPVNAVMDFYNNWLAAVQATNTDPYTAELNREPILTQQLRDQLTAAKGASSTTDPVLCQAKTPEKIGAKAIFVKDSTAQVLVISRKPEMSGQAIVNLTKGQDGIWRLDKITCSGNESAGANNYGFDQTGNLLKSDKMPPPLDPKYWYLVYEADGQKGHTAALLFDKQSTCVALDGTQSTCDPSKFMQTAKAQVQGNMTEAGVQVQKLTFVQ